MRLLVGKLKFNYILSNCAAIVVCSLVNFLLSDRLVFEARADLDSDIELTNGRAVLGWTDECIQPYASVA